jgi:hypothetical protein
MFISVQCSIDYYFSLLELECTFDNGLCSFTASTSKEEFLWRIETSEKLEDQLIHGPSFDIDDTTKGQFLFISGNLGSQNPPAITKLTSPTVKGSSDLTACLAFRYNLWVSELTTFIDYTLQSGDGCKYESSSHKKISVFFNKLGEMYPK